MNGWFVSRCEVYWSWVVALTNLISAAESGSVVILVLDGGGFWGQIGFQGDGKAGLCM